MGDQYIPSDATYHPSVFVPDDAEPPEMAVFNPPIEAALDNAAYLRKFVLHLAQLQALNFGAPVDLTGAPTLNCALFVSARRRWYVFGANREARACADLYTWDVSTLIGVGAADTNFCSADADASGNIIAAQTGGTAVSVYTDATSLWAVNSGIGGAASGRTNIVYDPINARWCFAGLSAGSYTVSTSTDRSTWAAASLVGLGFPTVPQTPDSIRLGVDKVTGTIVQLCYVAATGDFAIATSADGGQTWTHRDELVSAITSATTIELAHHPSSGAWMLTIGENVGTHGSECWTSPDGITWTKVASLAAHCLMLAAPLPVSTGTGAAWVSCTRAGDVVYTIDGGVTWRQAGFTGPTHGVFSGWAYGQLLGIQSASRVFVGLRAGLAGDVLA